MPSEVAFPVVLIHQKLGTGAILAEALFASAFSRLANKTDAATLFLRDILESHFADVEPGGTHQVPSGDGGYGEEFHREDRTAALGHCLARTYRADLPCGGLGSSGWLSPSAHPGPMRRDPPEFLSKTCIKRQPTIFPIFSKFPLQRQLYRF